MEILKRLVNHFVIISALLITSCGYMSDKPVENIDVYRADELQTCQIDLSRLGEIFKADQKQQIRCLQENFVQFTKYVRSKHPGAITEDELGIFVKKFFQGQSDAIIKGLSLIFQLNMILLKDEADRISHNNISPLFEILVEVNQEAVILSDIIKQMDDPKNQKNFWTLREKFNQATTRFSKSAIAVIEKSPGMPQKLNMRTFIIDMTKKIGDQDIDNETIDSFIFSKKLLVGGDEEIITTDELKAVIGKLPQILGLVFDGYYSKTENFKVRSDEIKFYLTSINKLYSTILFKQADFELLNSKELVKLAERFFKEYDVESFKPSIEALKVRFIGGKKDSVTLKDLNVVLTMFFDFFEKYYFNTVTYEDPVNTFFLTKPIALTDKEIVFRKLPGYDVFTNEARLKQLFASFQDTALNFRYFRDKASGTALYDSNISRNIYGLNEVNISKWLGYKLLHAYGTPDSNGVAQLNMDQFSEFLLDAKPLLQELKLWSANFKTFSRNTVLLGDLFQHQSNGDQLINYNEATEYIGMLLTAVDVSGKLSKSLTSHCDPGINTADPLYDADCFNENFYDAMLNNLGYKKSFPRLAQYVATSSKEEVLEYLEGVEGFARDSNAPGVPVNRRDSTLIVGALLNIETTFIRFDKNNDNIIDFDELSEAYLVYRNSIISLAGLKGDDVKYAKSVFLYMVSKMEVPKTGTWMSDLKFGAYHKCVQYSWCRENIEARRLNIGKLLYYMVNQAPSAIRK